VDLQKGRAKLLNPLDYILYLSFFPHVIAGPIIRVHQFSGQLQKKLTRNNDLRIGLYYFSIGFFLKTVGADNIGAGIDPFWTTEGVGGLDSAADYWSVAFLYYCQIYADFAGYSLMAIGMARLLGYKFPTNFRFPMIATSLQDFWRRWHITLSRWLRDYLYIPLGGSRNGITCTFSAIMITMLLGGLWHGAQWTFVVWGAVHGGGLVVERLLRIIPKNIRVNLTPLNWILTQLTVLIAWVFFRSPTVDFAYDFISSMFSIGSLADFNISSSIEILFAFALIPVLHNLLPKLPVHLSRKTRFKLHGIVTGLVLILGAVVHSAPNAFIYFRF
jgi:alginate O-acetyltransferase complex protein AlgI